MIGSFSRKQRLLQFGSTVSASLLLAACSGGGARPALPPALPTPPPPIPAPTPAPVPAPSPAPSPAPTHPDPTDEYNRSAALVAANAQYAYDKGLTGKDVTIAIIDTGIDTKNAEFAGRVSPDSKSFSSTYVRCMECAPETINYDLQDVQGHGTWVASVAAGAKNDSGTQGVAYESNILALKIGGPILDNLQPGQSPKEGGVNGAAIAPAMRYAMDHDAFVVNISINGGASGQVATDLRSAMDYVRSKNGLVVQSVQNDKGDSFAGTMTEAMVGSDFANKENFLFGIRVDHALNPIPGNGSPGALADRTLAVVADSLLVPGLNGEQITVGGNSFAAPAIAGAAALLKQYWPQLGGKEISQILLSSATDLGAPGVDQEYGAGLLNIKAALQAQEPSLGTSTAKLSSVQSSSLIVSPAFGGSSSSATFSSAAGQAVAIDKFGRDYKVNVGALIGSTRSSGISIASLAQPQMHVDLPSANNVLAAANYASNPMDGHVRRMPAGQFGFRLSPTAAIAGAVNSSIDSSDLMTGSLLRSSGIATFGASFDLYLSGRRFRFGTASSSYMGASSDTQRIGVQFENGLLVSLTNNHERGSALGMRGNGAFQIDGANSNFLTLGWSGNLAGFNLSGEAMAGHTTVTTRNALIAFQGAVLSSGFRMKTEHDAFGGTALFGMTSPLKVERAKLNYTVPVDYDLDTMSLITKTSAINLAPSAREFNFEAGWSKLFGRSYFSLNGAYGFNSGNVQGQSSAAAWMHFGTSF